MKSAIEFFQQQAAVERLEDEFFEEICKQLTENIVEYITYDYYDLSFELYCIKQPVVSAKTFRWFKELGFRNWWIHWHDKDGVAVEQRTYVTHPEGEIVPGSIKPSSRNWKFDGSAIPNRPTRKLQQTIIDLRKQMSTRHREDQRWVGKQIQSTFAQFADIQRKAKLMEAYRTWYYAEISKPSQKLAEEAEAKRLCEREEVWRKRRSRLATWLWWKIRPKDKETL